MKSKALPWLRIGIVFAAILGTVLFMMPLIPGFPNAGLDLSWACAINEAVARRLVFGRDIIFTMGPLGFVFSRMYHPATDWMMLCASGLIASGLAVGCALLPYPRKPLQVVILPVLIAETLLRDGFFIFLPFILLLLVLRVCAPADNEHHLRATGLIAIAVAIVTCAVALVPLVKGSYAGSAFFSGGLSCLMLLCRRPLIGVAFACFGIAIISGAWVVAGQPISALPPFFFAQGPIISGYSEALSCDGPRRDLVIYVPMAIILLVVFYHQFARRFGMMGLVAVASFAFTLFVCFKAAFVRHDVHAIIAGSALLLAAYSVSAVSGRVATLLLWAPVILAWYKIDHAHSGLNLAMASERIHSAIVASYGGIKMRVETPDMLRTLFDQQNAAIRAKFPLPLVEGSVDSYPSELSALFAHGLRWDPRPVIQSYSAYDPRLDALNAAHLEGSNAPRNIFFQVEPIDGRLPALDDAGSWPVLLSRYELVSKNGSQILMRLLEAHRSSDLLGAEILRQTARIGTSVQLPDTDDPLWAEIDLTPSLLGRIGLFLLKIPAINITLTLEDGRVIRHRYIPAIGERGFLLSPYIETTDDFVLLASGNSINHTVRSIRFDTSSPKMWCRELTIRLRRMNRPVPAAIKSW